MTTNEDWAKIWKAQYEQGMMTEQSYNAAVNSLTNPISPTNPPNYNPPAGPGTPPPPPAQTEEPRNQAVMVDGQWVDLTQSEVNQLNPTVPLNEQVRISDTGRVILEPKETPKEEEYETASGQSISKSTEAYQKGEISAAQYTELVKPKYSLNDYTSYQTGENEYDLVQAIKDGIPTSTLEKLGFDKSDIVKAQKAVVIINKAEVKLKPYKTGSIIDVYAFLSDHPEDTKTLKDLGYSEASIQRITSFNKENTRLPDGSYISNDVLKQLKEDSPDYYKIAITNGLTAVQTKIESENKASATALKKLDNYKAGEGYDIAKFLRTGGTEQELLDAGFDSDQIESVKQYNADTRGIGLPDNGKNIPKVSLEQFARNYYEDKGWNYDKDNTMAELPPQPGETIAEYNKRLAANIEVSKKFNEAESEYAKKYGTKAVIESHIAPIVSTFFLPARVIAPEVTFRDIRGMEWAIGSAQIALLAAPYAGGAVGSVAGATAGKLTTYGLQLAASGVFIKDTVDNWDVMSPAQKALSITVNALIIGNIVYAERGAIVDAYKYVSNKTKGVIQEMATGEAGYLRLNDAYINKLAKNLTPSELNEFNGLIDKSRSGVLTKVEIEQLDNYLERTTLQYSDTISKSDLAHIQQVINGNIKESELVPLQKTADVTGSSATQLAEKPKINWDWIQKEGATPKYTDAERAAALEEIIKSYEKVESAYKAGLTASEKAALEKAILRIKLAQEADAAKRKKEELEKLAQEAKDIEEKIKAARWPEVKRKWQEELDRISKLTEKNIAERLEQIELERQALEQVKAKPNPLPAPSTRTTTKTQTETKTQTQPATETQTETETKTKTKVYPTIDTPVKKESPKETPTPKPPKEEAPPQKPAPQPPKQVLPPKVPVPKVPKENPPPKESTPPPGGSGDYRIQWPIKTKGKEDKKQTPERFPPGTVAWKQGIGWWVFTPPYHKPSDRQFVLHKPKGAEITSSGRTAIATIQHYGGTPPKSLTFDMGIMDVAVEQPPRRPSPGAGRQAIKFKRDTAGTYGGQKPRTSKSKKVGPYFTSGGMVSRRPI